MRLTVSRNPGAVIRFDSRHDERGRTVYCVSDNGVGFDVQSVNASYSTRGSLGMVNMHERAERVDGSLRVDSSPGKGTTVTLVVPLEKHGNKGQSPLLEPNPRIAVRR